ncbi:MAG: hypothetical protein M3Y13_15735 [Armatimonadota bacterium]|nr:hypothetical protein [Armatimonadota bacterium]
MLDETRTDRAPWLLLPLMVMTLSGVTFLAPRHAAQAAPQAAPSAAKPALIAYDDGDGDELLEHWGNPKYAQEERVQLAGMAGGFLILGGLAFCKRRQRQTRGLTQILNTVSETELISERRKAA